MTARFDSANLDLSRLPPPEVVKDISYEVILAERIARLKELWPDLDTTNLETEPAVILQQEDAYREALDLAAINDAARAVMLAFATGADLDNIAAFYGVVRILIQARNPNDPTSVDVYESDTDLRRRAQLAPEALPYAGLTGGGYRFLALRAAPSLKDVKPLRRSGGRVDVVLLGRSGDGAVVNDVVQSVYSVFQDDEATQLTDVVSVRSAEIVNYAISIKLRIPLGPDPNVIKGLALAAVNKYAADRHRVDLPVYITGLIAAAQVGNVEQVVVLSPSSDVIATGGQAAFCISVTITHEIVT